MKSIILEDWASSFYHFFHYMHLNLKHREIQCLFFKALENKKFCFKQEVFLLFLLEGLETFVAWCLSILKSANRCYSSFSGGTSKWGGTVGSGNYNQNNQKKGGGWRVEGGGQVTQVKQMLYYKFYFQESHFYVQISTVFPFSSFVLKGHNTNSSLRD